MSCWACNDRGSDGYGCFECGRTAPKETPPMSQRTPEEIAGGAFHERECPAPIHWEETRRSIISRFAAAIARERETAETAGYVCAREQFNADATQKTRHLPGGVCAAKSGHVLLDDGRVLPMAPRADGNPVTFLLTNDGYIITEDSKCWCVIPDYDDDGKPIRVAHSCCLWWEIDGVKEATTVFGIFALEANAAAAAKGGG